MKIRAAKEAQWIEVAHTNWRTKLIRQRWCHPLVIAAEARDMLFALSVPCQFFCVNEFPENPV